MPTAKELKAEKVLQAKLATQKKASLDAFNTVNEGSSLDVLEGVTLYYVPNPEATREITVVITKTKDGGVYCKDLESNSLVGTDSDLYNDMRNQAVFTPGTEITIEVVAKYPKPRTEAEIDALVHTYSESVFANYLRRLRGNKYMYYHVSGLDD
jgi:myo-inositol-hexaphosphate 3-phosphohydrolase